MEIESIHQYIENVKYNQIDDYIFPYLYADVRELKTYREDQLERLKKSGVEVQETISSFLNGQNADFIGLTGEINTITSGKYKSYCFKKPLLSYWHKRLPCIMLTNKDFNVKILSENPKNIDGVKEALSWTEIIRNSTANERKIEKDAILHTISSYGMEEYPKFVRFLKTKCQFMGIGYNIRYLKEEKIEGGEHRALYVHPFGGVTLLFKQKSYPFVYMTNPSLNFNTSHLNKNTKNKFSNKETFGITD